MKTILFRTNEETNYTDFTPVAEPLGDTLSLTRTALDIENERALIGIWECTPGTWRRQVVQAEYSYFIEGAGKFFHDSGEIIEFKPGDAIYFPENSTGIWEIHNTVRKSYVILK